MADWTRVSTPIFSSAFCIGERVHHRRQHAHIIGGRAVEALGGAGKAAEDVAAADHEAERMAAASTAALISSASRATASGSMPELALAHQRFARQLQEDAVEARARHEALP